MQGLQARLVAFIPSPEGPQADLIIVEPNGDEHPVRCLCRTSGTTVIGEFGDGGNLDYLNQRYGDTTVCSVCREATLASS